MEKTVDQIKQEIIDELSLFEDWISKFEYIIDLGKKMSMPEDLKKQEYMVEGCSSRAWIVPQYKDGKLYFETDGDAVMAKGMMALVLRLVNGRTPDEILNTDFSFLEEIGLIQNLSPSRAGGLESMIEKIKEYAKQAKEGKL